MKYTHQLDAANAKGYFQTNALGAYSLNNLTARPETGGAYDSVRRLPEDHAELPAGRTVLDIVLTDRSSKSLMEAGNSPEPRPVK